jgi:hypothetical protein
MIAPATPIASKAITSIVAAIGGPPSTVALALYTSWAFGQCGVREREPNAEH